jgi:hypothetical protein
MNSLILVKANLALSIIGLFLFELNLGLMVIIVIVIEKVIYLLILVGLSAFSVKFAPSDSRHFTN